MKLALAALTLLCFQSSHAHAAAGDGLGAGLVFGLDKAGTFSLGWEAGAMATQPVLKASVGGSYALNAGPGQPGAIHYVAFEPWLLLGGTLGAALEGIQRVDFMYGVWEGAPITLKGKLLPDRGTVHPRFAWLLTLTVGCRIFGARPAQFYFAPKLWRYEVHTWDG